MDKISKLLHLLYWITTFFQIAAIIYIIVEYNKPQVPIHFSFNGTADSFGEASTYFILIGINLVAYFLTVIFGRYMKVDMKKFFRTFKSKDDEIQAQETMKRKIRIFLLVITTNLSVFIAIIIGFLLYNILGNLTDYTIDPAAILVFFITNLLILVFGLVWINRPDR